MKYRLGLDIGIASVGFSVMQTGDDGEPYKIEDLGVRVFDKAEQPDSGASLAEPRRLARGARRIIRRRAHRRERVAEMLKTRFGAEVLEKICANEEDLYFIRYKGINEKLSAEELGKVLLYFVKHRGFLSNRKAEKDDKDGGKLIKATGANRVYLQEKGYRTVGEMLYKDGKYSHTEKNKNGEDVKVYTTRNKENEYDNTFLRDDLKAELTVILEKQKEFGLIDGAFAEKYLKIFYTNRNYDEGPAEPSPYSGGYAIGRCPFEKDELRAPKASYTVEYFTALGKLNNLKIKENGETRCLDEEERRKVADAIKTKKEIKFADLRKLLNLSDSAYFNLLNYSSKKSVGDTEKSRFVSLGGSYDIKKCLSGQNGTDIDLIDSIAEILSTLKSDDKRMAAFDKISELSAEEKAALLCINVSKFGGTSLKFMRNVLPYLEQGYKYSDACKKAGYDHTGHNGASLRTRLLNTKEIREQVNEIAVPVVKRAVSQTIKVINAAINKYGSPIAINVELARELSKNYDERKKIFKDNEMRAKENEAIKEKLQKEFNLVLPTGQDILKYRLYEEQGGKCAYTQNVFDVSRLFEPNYAQIDHIIPYSKSYDDSMNNKVLVFTQENQNKKDRLPFEYFGQDAERWKRFEAFVGAQYKGKKGKAERLLKKKFTEEDAKDWKERNLNDTKYITSFVYNLLKDNLEFAPCDSLKEKVVAVNGKITSYMRKMLGLTKVREEGDKHHALDAAVIACVTEGEKRKITEYNKGKERFLRVNGNFISTDGEIISEDEFDAEFGIKLKPPYKGFTEELKYRLADNPKYYEQFFIKQGYDESELDALKPIFVSRMVNRKVKGQIHKATVCSAKIYEETGLVISKTSLDKLKLKNDKKGSYYLSDYGDYYIENYYRPQDDRLLYERLLKMLIDEPKHDAKEAFKGVVYKPKSDGTDGAPVKKVKTVEKATSGMLLGKVNGFADNGKMVRVDVFRKDGKYYTVPVYLKDAYAKKLPNKAVVNAKPYKEWIEMDESYEFLFSLYKNDLIYVRHKKGITLSKTNSKNKDDVITIKEGYLYYNSLNISGGKATCFTHDNSYGVSSLGLKTLDLIRKCTVDVLGNVSFVEKETRQDFRG